MCFKRWLMYIVFARTFWVVICLGRYCLCSKEAFFRALWFRKSSAASTHSWHQLLHHYHWNVNHSIVLDVSSHPLSFFRFCGLNMPQPRVPRTDAVSSQRFSRIAACSCTARDPLGPFKVRKLYIFLVVILPQKSDKFWVAIRNFQQKNQEFVEMYS